MPEKKTFIPSIDLPGEGMDRLINKAQEEGIALRSLGFPSQEKRVAQTQTKKAGFDFSQLGSMLLDALLGAAGGARAGFETAELGEIPSAVSAFAAGYQQPMAYATQRAKQSGEIVENTIINEQTAPELLAVSPIFKGMTFGVASKFLGLPIAEKRGELAAEKAVQQNITPAEAKALRVENKLTDAQELQLIGVKKSLVPYLIPGYFWNPDTGQLLKQFTPRTEPAIVPGAAEAKKGFARLETLRNSIDIMKVALANIPSGRIFGNVAKYWSRLTAANPAVAQAERQLVVIMTSGPRMMGEVGNLNMQEQQNALKLAPRLEGSKQERLEAIKDFIVILENAQERSKYEIGGAFGPVSGPRYEFIKSKDKINELRERLKNRFGMQEK